MDYSESPRDDPRSRRRAGHPHDPALRASDRRRADGHEPRGQRRRRRPSRVGRGEPVRRRRQRLPDTGHRQPGAHDHGALLALAERLASKRLRPRPQLAQGRWPRSRRARQPTRSLRPGRRAIAPLSGDGPVVRDVVAHRAIRRKACSERSSWASSVIERSSFIAPRPPRRRRRDCRVPGDPLHVAAERAKIPKKVSSAPPQSRRQPVPPTARAQRSRARQQHSHRPTAAQRQSLWDQAFDRPEGGHRRGRSGRSVAITSAFVRICRVPPNCCQNRDRAPRKRALRLLVRCIKSARLTTPQVPSRFEQWGRRRRYLCPEGELGWRRSHY